MEAVISISMLTAVPYPWQLIVHDDMEIVSPYPLLFPVVSYTDIEFEVNCVPTPDELCVQEWKVGFVVDKICDVESVYDIKLHAENSLTAEVAFVIYSFRVSQAAVCGILIQEVPLTGELYFVDETYTERWPRDVFQINTYAYM
eukprot:UN27421